ncbi:MAG: hypothetical protein GWP91_15960 [Rhodobacterales bacterium]|nr:hypothetical protein [Rhodobacterales bacterium]
MLVILRRATDWIRRSANAATPPNRLFSPLLFLMACTPSVGPEVEPCEQPGALASCLQPTMSSEYYVEHSSAYFDTMDYTVELDGWPPYSELVVRWEWYPWLKLTAYGKDHIESTDALLTLYPSVVPERDCRFFDTQPFGRCFVVFYYDAHAGKPCPIYEEFTFNDEGEITFIEAWSDLDGLRPQRSGDPWAEADDVRRLSGVLPGLGDAQGKIDLHGAPMNRAAEEDADIADFVYRADNWYETWLAEYDAAGDDYWDVGCGW